MIIYATKTGIELAARGIPVIVAGEAWLRGKGIGFDCDDAGAYERMLASLPFGKRLDAERIARAQAYAYHFFFRRMITLPGLRRARVPGVPYEIAPLGLVGFRARSERPRSTACAMGFWKARPSCSKAETTPRRQRPPWTATLSPNRALRRFRSSPNIASR